MNLECIPTAERLAGEALGLAAVPIPALVVVLTSLAEQKGAALTREEVEAARNKCACVMLPANAIRMFRGSRGYADVRLEHVWEDWQAVSSGHPVSS